jgi:predicted homoserine dehydrogenase-like protein
MIQVDNALKVREKEGDPIKIAVAGGGTLARMLALQFLTPLEGMRLVAIGNRTLANAERAYKEAGANSITTVTTVGELEDAIAKGVYAVTDNPMLLCEASNVDIILDATGTVEFGARLAVYAIENHKHLALLNSELDSTLGPILKVHADRAGVTVTNTDGEEPGVAMNLMRYLKTVGLEPVAAGNLKGMLDPYRTPETQRSFAEKYSMNPKMATSFADGTKLAMEAAILANGSGFKVGKRGMYGIRCAHIKEIANHLPLNQLLDGGLVDYALGADPYTGIFVVVHENHPIKKKHLSYLKMWEGPLYVFYTPIHLPHIQVASSVARAVLLRDATIAPIGAPVCDVASIAKKDLKSGEVLDGFGGFTAYGVIENSDVFDAEELLPIGLSGGCRLIRDIQKDAPIKYTDVELPEGRFSDKLRAEQNLYFSLHKNKPV